MTIGVILDPMPQGTTTWVLLALAVASLPAPARAQTNLEEANERAERGEALFGAGDYDAALAEFERAYELAGDDPTRFLILYNIAQAHERRFRYDLAMRYLRRFLDEGGAETDLRPTVEARIDALSGLLATIHVRLELQAGTELTAEVWIGDRQVGEAPGDVLVPAGRHVLEVRAEGYAPARREMQLAARTEETVSFALAPYGAGLEPSFFWISMLTAGVAAIGGGVLGIAALVQHDQVAAQLADPAGGFLVDVDAENETIRTLTIAADISFGAAALFGTTAVVLALFTQFDAAPRTAQRAVRLLPVPGGLVCEGAF